MTAADLQITRESPHRTLRRRPLRIPRAAGAGQSSRPTGSRKNQIVFASRAATSRLDTSSGTVAVANLV